MKAVNTGTFSGTFVSKEAKELKNNPSTIVYTITIVQQTPTNSAYNSVPTKFVGQYWVNKGDRIGMQRINALNEDEQVVVMYHLKTNAYTNKNGAQSDFTNNVIDFILVDLNDTALQEYYTPQYAGTPQGYAPVYQQQQQVPQQYQPQQQPMPSQPAPVECVMPNPAAQAAPQNNQTLPQDEVPF